MLDWIILAGSMGVLFLAAVLEVDTTEHVFVPIWNLKLPGTCMFRYITNVPCPSCGLTRGFIHLMHGNLAAAWRVNPATSLLFVTVWIQIPYRTRQLWRSFHGQPRWDASRYYPLLWLLPIALLVQWIISAISA